MTTSAKAALLLLCLMAVGCASTPFGRDIPTLEQVQALEQRVLDLQRKAAMDEIEIDRLRQQLAELQPHRDALPPRTGQAPARPPATRPAPPSEPVMREAPAPAIEERDLEVAPPTSRPPAPRTAPPAASATAPAPLAAGGAPEPITPAIQALYDRGYTLYHQGHFVDAEASFQRFLQAHPASELSDNAQYWIGECRYSRGDYKGALAAFRETVARYPEGNKVPDALLKAGESLQKLGDAEGARAMYQEVIRRFPQSAVAAVAQERRGKLP